MKADEPLFSIATFLVLAAMTCVESVQLLGMAFAIGESGGPESFLNSALLLVTVFGVLGLAIAALGTLTGKRAIAIIGLVSGLLVLPMALLFSWVSLHADIMNSSIPVDPAMSNPIIHISLMRWIFDGVAVPLDLAAIWFCWLRIRRSPAEIRIDVAESPLQE